MNHKETFEAFFDDIHMKDVTEYEDDLGGVIKKLNQHYYDSNDAESNRVIVGSVGRGTAVDGCSDLDVVFKLPGEEYSRYDNREGNGQSALLQDVKKILKSKYPNTDIKGDGQAVVISFTNKPYTIDLVPAFEQSDGSFKYPDTNDGGSWRTTKPTPEQDACKIANAETSENFTRACNALRIWKEHIGSCFGGLLIDTLVNNYRDDIELGNVAFEDYYNVLQEIFSKLKSENPEQSYWLALGSKQHVENKGRGAFVRKAKKAYDKLNNAKNELEKEEALIALLGNRFEECIVGSESQAQENRWAEQYGSTDTEEFIESKFPVEIRYSVKIDCGVTQKGWRPRKLLEMLAEGVFLHKDKTLDFEIVECTVPKPYDVYWKVRNVGEIAHRKNQIRGQIEKGPNKTKHRERTHFSGPHFVECYIVKNRKCVARDRIDVPIKAE